MNSQSSRIHTYTWQLYVNVSGGSGRLGLARSRDRPTLDIASPVESLTQPRACTSMHGPAYSQDHFQQNPEWNPDSGSGPRELSLMFPQKRRIPECSPPFPRLAVVVIGACFDLHAHLPPSLLLWGKSNCYITALFLSHLFVHPHILPMPIDHVNYKFPPTSEPEPERWKRLLSKHLNVKCRGLRD